MNSTIVRINGEDITEILLESAVSRYIIQMEEDEDSDFEPTKDNMKFIKTEVLNRLIERTLLLQKAAVEKIEVKHETVHQNIDRMRSNFTTEEEWKENLISLHIQEENLFDELKKDMTIEKFLNEHYISDTNFSEKELQEYYNNNEKLMKEPDLFSFYEIYCDNADIVKSVYNILQEKDIYQITEALEKAGLEFHNHTDIPAYQLPEEVYNVMSDLEIGKVATMQAPECGMLVYKLNGKIIGKKLIYDEIKEKLAQYLVQSARAEETDKIIKEEMDKAVIKYVDSSYLEK